MDALLFVYGTLKEGFPNHARNPGVRVPGSFRTRQAFPLYVVQLPFEDRAPWLVDRPGQGEPVAGEVYRIDAATWPAMDAFEEVGLETGYVRVEIDLESTAGSNAAEVAIVRAHAYLKPPGHLGQCLAMEGPFAEYTLALAAGYWLTVPSIGTSAAE